MVKFKVIESIDELPELSVDYPVFADVETQELYIGLRLVQLYQPQTADEVFVIDADCITEAEIEEFIKPLHTIWWGASYDFGTLKYTTVKFDDLQYASRIAYPAWKSYKLDDVMTQLGYDKFYGDLDKRTMQKAGFRKGCYLSQNQYRYASTDVYALSLMWEDKQLHRAMETAAYKLDILSLGYSIRYQNNGLVVNQKAVQDELAKIVDTIAENEVKLNGLNPNSPKQVKEALGTDSSDKKTLIRLISEGGPKAQLADLVFKQRRLLKRRTMLNSYNHPKVYTYFNPNGAVTSRFTATGGDNPLGINAQQITRDLQYIFNSDTEDTVVIHADYSTAELRAGASIMQDEAMYNELKAGLDLHVEAAIMAGVDRGIMVEGTKVYKDNRQKGKAISFGKIFGQSPASFIEYAYTEYGVVLTLEESQEIHSKYINKYKGIYKYHKTKWNNYKTTPVVTPLGHRNMARLGTDAINYATQGGVAETTKLAVHYLCQEYPEAVKYIYNVVHDAIYLRVPRTEYEKWVPRLGKAMKKGWTELCKCPLMYYKDIPMPIEVEYLDKVEVF